MKISTSAISYRANKMPYPQAKYFKDKLTSSKNVDIICHELTDKDAANSALAMDEYLKNQGINSRILLSQDLKALGLKINNSNIVQFEDFNPQKEKNTVLCVDFCASDRVPSKIYDYIKRADKLYGIDHHKGIDIVDGNYTCINSTINETLPLESVSSYYVDTTAKSASAIIYRFLEALGEDISNSQAYAIFSGLMSDCNKKGLVRCDGENGVIELKKEFVEDKNTYEIYQKLREKLTAKQIREIAKSVDLISNLTPEEKKFKDSLKDRIILSPNKKIAYVEITPDDKEWEDLGSDNPITSTILNRFRVDVINNKFQDEKLKDVVLALVFYKAGENYRISAHAKDNSLLKFFDYAKTKTTNSIHQSLGGHSERGGGKIASLDKDICHKWVLDIISCGDFYD